MEKNEQYYNRPVLREGVSTRMLEEGAVFSYSNTSFDIEFSSQFKPALQKFLTGLRSGLDFSQFAKEFPQFTQYAGDLLNTFDRYGFVTESLMPPPGQFISGSSFWKEVDAFASRFLLTADLPLSEIFNSDQVTEPILINYAVQYYHFVKAGPQIIAAAYATANHPEISDILEKFLVAELEHDKLLLQALAGAGIDPDKVRSTIPLPETFALISSFQVMAHQEPLSFYSCLFLVEEKRPDFNERFAAAAKKLGFKESFYQPILDHSHINEDEDHGAISESLLKCYSEISQEARIVALKQVNTALESLAELENAIINEADACAKSIGWLTSKNS